VSEAARLTLARYREAVRDCASMNFRQIARLVTARYDAALRPAGLRATQLNLLMAIEASAVTSVTELAEILAVDRTTLTRNLKLVRSRGLVDPDSIALTRAGEEAAAAALPLWAAVQAQVVEMIGAERWPALRHEHEAIRQSIRAGPLTSLPARSSKAAERSRRTKSPAPPV
jgi:DNA-binding MarR family transcriptional regulator